MQFTALNHSSVGILCVTYAQQIQKVIYSTMLLKSTISDSNLLKHFCKLIGGGLLEVLETGTEKFTLNRLSQ